MGLEGRHGVASGVATPPLRHACRRHDVIIVCLRQRRLYGDVMLHGAAPHAAVAIINAFNITLFFIVRWLPCRCDIRYSAYNIYAAVTDAAFIRLRVAIIYALIYR